MNKLIAAKCLMVFGHALQWVTIYIKAKIYQERYEEQKNSPQP